MTIILETEGLGIIDKFALFLLRKTEFLLRIKDELIRIRKHESILSQMFRKIQVMDSLAGKGSGEGLGLR